MHTLGRVALAVCLALLGYYALLFVVQRRLLYPAPTGPSLRSIPSDATPLALASPDSAAVPAWYLAAESVAPSAIVLFHHGNAERAEDWLGEFGALRRAGLAVLVIEYPGYGVAEGAPTQESLTAASLAAYDWVRGAPRLAQTPIVAYGRSLGGGVAARLATRRKVDALILESTFTDLRSFARSVFAPGFLVRDPYDNVGELRRYRGPLLVLHGRSDEIAPFDGGRTLANIVQGAEFVAMPCGHNDCARPWDTIIAFVGHTRTSSAAPPSFPQ